MSSTRQVGLTGDSTKIARVFLRIELRNARRSSGSANVTSIPIETNSSPNNLRVPP